MSYTDATDQLVTFLSANRFALVNQFVCESYDPVHFAAWSRKVNDATGAQVHVLFDNAVHTHPLFPCLLQSSHISYPRTEALPTGLECVYDLHKGMCQC